MKKIFFTILTILYVLNTIAQAPNKMSYQAVIRNNSNTLVVNQTVGMRISILQNSSTGTAVYIETQTPMTNTNGLATLEIGTGTVVSGVFASINWSAGPYFIKTETDPTGGSIYSIVGTSQLMSVPYALYAQNSGNTLNPGVGIIISGSTIEAIDNSYLNELQTLTISNDTIKLNPSGGFVTLPNITNNWDISGTDIYNNNIDNVGIGTSTPTSKLDVNGQVTINQKNFGGYGGLLIKGDGPGSNQPNIAFSTVNNIGNDEVAAIIGAIINDNVIGNESMDLSFSTAKYGLSSLLERMRITADGNVGINNPNPDRTAALDVFGKIKSSNIQLTSGAINGHLLTSDASGNASWQAPNSWQLIGNSATTTNHFIGTTDVQSLRFKVNNRKSGIIDTFRFFTSFGYASLENSTDTGYGNSAFGFYSLNQNTNGYNNTAVGTHSLYNNVTGNNSTSLGVASGAYNYFSNDNVFLGAFSGFRSNGDNSIAIGNYCQFLASNQARVGNLLTASIGGYQDWTNISDGRYKKNIQENVPGLSFILKLKPVTYNLDIEKLKHELGFEDTVFTQTAINEASERIQTGFIAQDVENIAKELGFSFSGVDAPQNENDHYGLRYAQFTVPLVKAVQEQQLQIELLQNQINELKKILLEITK